MRGESGRAGAPARAPSRRSSSSGGARSSRAAADSSRTALPSRSIECEQVRRKASRAVLERGLLPVRGSICLVQHPHPGRGGASQRVCRAPAVDRAGQDSPIVWSFPGCRFLPTRGRRRASSPRAEGQVLEEGSAPRTPVVHAVGGRSRIHFGGGFFRRFCLLLVRRRKTAPTSFGLLGREGHPFPGNANLEVRPGRYRCPTDRFVVEVGVIS